MDESVVRAPPFPRHCEERSDEAIQGHGTVLAALDCFVAKRLLAMTVTLSSMGVGRRPVKNSQ
jgi:hypothetical protein